MEKVEHIGIAVRSLEQAIPLYEKLLGVSCYKREYVEAEKVETAFFKAGETKIELLEGLSPESAITRFVAKSGEGMHHIAFLVDDIRGEMERLREAGFTLLSEAPKKGADNKLVCFIHPKSVQGVLTELCQEIG